MAIYKFERIFGESNKIELGHYHHIAIFRCLFFSNNLKQRESFFLLNSTQKQLYFNTKYFYYTAGYKTLSNSQYIQNLNL